MLQFPKPLDSPFATGQHANTPFLKMTCTPQTCRPLTTTEALNEGLHKPIPLPSSIELDQKKTEIVSALVERAADEVDLPRVETAWYDRPDEDDIESEETDCDDRSDEDVIECEETDCDGCSDEDDSEGEEIDCDDDSEYECPFVDSQAKCAHRYDSVETVSTSNYDSE